VAQAVTSSADDAQLGTAVRVHQDTGVEDRDQVVVAPVDHQQRTGRKRRCEGDGPELAELPGPRVHVGREGPILDHPDLARVLQEPARV
jgi:hypothetical protein